MASRASMLINVTSRPDPGVVEKVPSWWKYRSPSSPLPGTARTSLTETMRPAADGVMWMESTVPLNILEASLSLQVAQPDAFLAGGPPTSLCPVGGGRRPLRARSRDQGLDSTGTVSRGPDE